MRYEQIPEELKNKSQWVCWQLEPAEPKPRKIPINPHTGGRAKSNDPSTWSDFKTAVSRAANHSGIGFMFNGDYIGIDIDDVQADIEAYRAGDGDNIVAEFIHTCESYAEVSTSGKGIHIICSGSLPDGRKRKKNVEIYTKGRYFIMTGDVISPSRDIKDGSETVKLLRAKYLDDDVPRYLANERHNLSTNEVVEKVRDSKQAQAFDMLYSGAWQGFYGSQSEADLAFCNMLAFWTAKDPTMMQEIFRQSGLYRKKWDTLHGDATYGEQTIQKAIADCRDTYTPGYTINIGKGKDVKRFPFDDTGNADRFVYYEGGRARYCHTDKHWYIWTGSRWKADANDSIKLLAEDVIKEMWHERELCQGEDEEKAFDKHKKSTRSSRGKENMLKESQHRLTVSPDKLDKQSDLFNVQNGVLNLRTGSLMPHDKDLMLSKISSVEYTDKADCPLWHDFLEEIFCGDMTLIQYVQKAIGYSLTGSNAEQCMFFCYGTGSNGKSTFLDVIRDLMGDYAANTQADVLMIKQARAGGATPELARLKGARFVTTSESNEGVRLDEALIKQLTGGDVITTRFLYGKEFEYTPGFKIWMATNHKPIIRGRDLGIWRRIHLIPFNARIPDDRKDKRLSYKLRKELPAILNWALEGALKWQKEGLKMPAVMQAAANAYKGEMDVVYAFLKECTHEGIGETKASDIFQAYLRWATDNNEYKMSSTKFYLELGERYRKERKKYGIVYLGVRLNEEYDANGKYCIRY